MGQSWRSEGLVVGPSSALPDTSPPVALQFCKATVAQAPLSLQSSQRSALFTTANKCKLLPRAYSIPQQLWECRVGSKPILYWKHPSFVLPLRDLPWNATLPHPLRTGICEKFVNEKGEAVFKVSLWPLLQNLGKQKKQWRICLTLNDSSLWNMAEMCQNSPKSMQLSFWERILL